MATSTDPFATPLAPRAGLSTAPDPFAPWTPMSSSGLGGLGSSTADMAVLAERLVRPSQFELPDIKPPSKATPLYNPSTKELFVNGLRFTEDDAEAALRSEQYLNAPLQAAPAGDWVPLDDATYQQYLQNIRQPGLGRLLSKGFGRSVDQFQMLAGRGLQLAGAEELGGRIVEQQMEDLRKTAPYSRQFTDIRSASDAVDWLAVNAAEQGVNIIESIVTGALGFLAGTAASGTPLGGAAAGLASIIGKETWKNGVKATLAKQVRGEALDAAETKLLRNAAGIAGATVATVASGYAQGAADIYGEFREQGAGPDDAGARLLSLAGGIPYAALNLVPEAVLASRLMGRVGARPALSTLPTRKAKAGEILKRGAMGGAAGGALEGTMELGQEALLLWLTDQELGSPENIKRLINSFAAGAAIGGPIGAGANILNPTNLLNPGGATGPVSTNQPVTPTTPVQGELFPDLAGGPAVSPLLRQDRASEQQLQGERQRIESFIANATAEVQAMASGNIPLDPARIQQVQEQVRQARFDLQRIDAELAQIAPATGVTPTPGQLGLFQPTPMPPAPPVALLPPGPMMQGELALTGGAVAPGYTPPQALAPEAPVEPGLTPEEAAAQGALQFAPPAPEGRPVGAMANQLQAIQDRLRREREFANLQAQRAAEREAELDALQRTGQIGRDLFDATTLAAGAPVTEGLPPMVPAPRTPQQLPLFRGGLPRPTRRQLPPARAQAAPLPSAPVGVVPEQLALPGMAQPLSMEAAKAAWEERRPANVRKWDALSEESRQAWADAIEEGTATPARRVEISRADSVARLKPKKAAPPTEPPTPPKPKKSLKPPKPPAPKGAKGEKLKTPAPPPPEEKPTAPKGEAAVPPPPPPPPPKPTEDEELDAGIRRNADSPEQVASFLSYALVDQSHLSVEMEQIALVYLTQGAGAGRKALTQAVNNPGSGFALMELEGDEVSTYIQETDAFLAAKTAIFAEAAPAAPTVTDIADPSLAEVPTPEVLYRAVGSAVGATKAQAQRYPGTFWSSLKELVTKKYAKVTRRIKQRTKLPKRTLNVTALSTVSPESKAAMLADFRAWMARSFPDVDIEDTYLYEVLANNESDFVFPTEYDNAYLTRKGYDAVFFEREGGEKVNTWYLIGDVEAFVVPWADVPDAAKAYWLSLDPDKRTAEAAENLLDDLLSEKFNDQRGGNAVSTVEFANLSLSAGYEALEMGDAALFSRVVATIVNAAYFPGQDYKSIQSEALQFFADLTQFNDAQLTEIADAFIEAAQTILGGPEARTKKSKTGTGTAGLPKPWYSYALNTPGMMERLAAKQVVFRSLTLEEAQQFLKDGILSEVNIPADTLKSIEKLKASEATKANPQKSAATALAKTIYDLNTSRGVQLNTAAQKKKIQQLRGLWQKVVAEGTQDFLDQAGRPVSAYFDAEGNPYTEVVDGELRVNTTASTAETKAKREAVLREAAKPAKAEPKVNTFEAWLNGRNFVDLDGKPIAKPLDLGRVKLTVARFVSKLLRKPKVHVFRNQADLKARNPQLHAAAAAERPGDFDTVNAVGYSFGDGQVIIFTDRVRTEAQLRFVLAHETLGHFGLRSLLPEREFNALMLDLYERSPGIRLAVDRAMAVRGLSKPEAVEEYLSDFAAALDVSFINRVWNAIKGALNKLGIEFGDEAARYLVGQARRYVYSGQRSAVFDTAAVMSRIQAMETGQDPYKTGRFAVQGDLRADNRAAGALYSSLGELPTNLPDAWNQIKGKVGDTFSSLDKFNQTVFSLFNFRARENPGLAALERVLSDGRGLSMRIKNALNEQLALVLNRAVEVPFSNIKAGGITEEQRAQLGKLLYDAQRYASSRLKRLSALGKTPLFSVDPATGVLTPNQPEIDKLFDQGLVSFEQALKGFSYTDTYMGPEGEPITEVVEIPGIEGLTKDSIVWRGYLKTREAMRNVELELLRARYYAFTQDRDLAFREIDAVTRGGKLTGEERQFFERMYRKYRDLWTADKTFDADGEPTLNPDSIDNANKFLVAFNTALIAKEKAANDAEAQRRNSALAEFFTGAAADDVVANIEAFKDRFIRTDETEFLIQNRIKDIVAGDISNSDADLYTKRTLATGYTPVLRRGSAQVRVVATTVDGKPVRLQQDYKDQLVYSQFEKQSEAVEMARTINETLFTAKTYKVMAFNENTLKFEMMDVKLQAVPEAALDAIAAPPDLNLNEFTRGLRQFDIVLPPGKLKQVIIALTRQNNRARQRLQRGFVPGADPDAVRAVAEHIEARASTIAKVVMRPKLSELTNLNMQSTQLLWNGDAAKLQRLKAKWEANPQDTGAKREYEAYAFMYDKTNPKSGVARGNQYYNEGARAVAFLDNNRDVNESDFGAGKVASSIRAFTSMVQLGGSIATGALNYLGAITNSLPYLATYNEKTAFGGGFGLGPTIASFQRALSQVGFIKGVRGQFTDEDLGTAEFYDRMLGGDTAEQRAKAKALRDRFGLTEDEARFMARETREGTMIPALSNSLVGTARGRVRSAAGQKFMDGWMWTFNSTEQAVRRAVGLAAYRMERARAIGNNMEPKDADAKARETAVNALNFTLGDYAVMNRPPLWQTGFQSFIYMYKVFPTTTIQVLSRLPWKGRRYMLAALFVLGGITAFPFAEDLEDILDTIAQGLGLKMASVRVELAQMLDEVFPGMSPYVLRGFANSYFPGNIADRVSVGNFIPGTGILLAGANVGRELTDIAGPAAGMLTGIATSSIDLLRAMTTERVTMIDVLRESPVTMGRALGDTIAYVQSGAIVDRRGYVVSQEIPTTMLAARLLGFYPSEAAQQYDVIRASKRITDYQKEVVAGFRVAWIKAKIQGNEAQAQAIVESVNDWNEGARGTALEIRNFLPNANRALREAQRPAGERFLRAAPRAAREELSTIESLLGYTD